jgi:flavorubredoxin
MKEITGAGTILNELKEVNLNKLVDFDAILLGSPNHIGNATRGIRKFINNLGKLNLEGKLIAVFDTYMGRDFEKAVKQMEKEIIQKIPGVKMATPGLSVQVNGVKGPITEGELVKSKEFGSKIATQLKNQV